MYYTSIIVLCLAILIPVPAYLLYCHLNKKEPDRKMVQLSAFGTLIPAITLLTWDEFLDPGAACVIFGAIVGFAFAKFAGDGKKE